MVKIRLRRMGAKKAPYYRIVVADSRCPRDAASSRRSELMIPWQRAITSRSISNAQSTGYPTVLSLQKPYAACLLKSRPNKEKLPA